MLMLWCSLAREEGWVALEDAKQQATTGSEQRSVVAAALDALMPIDAAYATLPILQGFNWVDCLATVEEGKWFLVVFRSVRSEMYDDALVTEFDEQAYQEALESSGLLYYFRGGMNEQRQCLSLCVWENQTQAHVASRLPRHQAAARLARDAYMSFGLERHLLVKSRGSVTLELEPLPPVHSHSGGADTTHSAAAVA